MYTRCVIPQFIWRTRKSPLNFVHCEVTCDDDLCVVRRESWTSTLLQASFGWEAARGGSSDCREMACVFWAQRCATAGVGVLSFSFSLFIPHTIPRGRRMETSSLCERKVGVSETYDTKPLSHELQRFNPRGLASESMIFIIKMPRKSMFAGVVPWPLTDGNALEEREALRSSKWVDGHRK